MHGINRMKLQSVEFEHTLCVAELKSNALERSVNLTLLTKNIPYCLVLGNTKRCEVVCNRQRFHEFFVKPKVSQ
jgi:hypothetical protein